MACILPPMYTKIITYYRSQESKCDAHYMYPLFYI
ncbi:unnamed protein product [Bacillus thuringiensis DB27]|uniref:Uncharacterized protein n=1 Tax=Bacillus thuringiensis DB27 TaxID=1431339 RepID=W8YLF2_BACTU|nr:unnamed protein product [Bacillus thuringiensis DB27]